MIYTAAPDGLSIDIQRKQLKGALLDRITENDFDIRCNDEEGDYVANDAAYGNAIWCVAFVYLT